MREAVDRSELVKDFDLIPKEKQTLAETIRGLENIVYKWEMSEIGTPVPLTDEWIKCIYDAISLLKEKDLALKGGDQE